VAESWLELRRWREHDGEAGRGDAVDATSVMSDDVKVTM
jgi:hypothetical protein